MKKLFVQLIFIGILQSQFNLFSVVSIPTPSDSTSESEPKLDAFTISKTESNVYDKWNDLFKVFSLSNMGNPDLEINRQIFVHEELSKCYEIQLVKIQYQSLK